MVKNKKGVLGNLQGLIIPLVGVGIVIAIGILIMAEVKDQVLSKETIAGCNSSEQTNCSGAYNGTLVASQALNDIPGWLPIIVITVIGALLISLVGIFRGRQ